MQNTVASPFPVVFNVRSFLITALAVLLVLGGILAAWLGGFFAPARPVVSEDVFAEKYGLRVNLAAVTAAGGLVDIRFKILNAEKAAAILKDKQKFPAIYDPATGVILQIAVDARPEVELVDGGNYFLMFRNSGSVVRSGKSIIIRLGDLDLAPIIVK